MSSDETQVNIIRITPKYRYTLRTTHPRLQSEERFKPKLSPHLVRVLQSFLLFHGSYDDALIKGVEEGRIEEGKRESKREREHGERNECNIEWIGCCNFCAMPHQYFWIVFAALFCCCRRRATTCTVSRKQTSAHLARQPINQHPLRAIRGRKALDLGILPAISVRISQ